MTPPLTVDAAYAAFAQAEQQTSTDTTTFIYAQAALQSLQTQQATDLANFQAQQAQALSTAQNAFSSAQAAVTLDNTAEDTALNNLLAAVQALIASEGGNTPPAQSFKKLIAARLKRAA